MCLKEFVSQASKTELSPLLGSWGFRTEVMLDHSVCLMEVKAGWWLSKEGVTEIPVRKVTSPAWWQEGDLMALAPIRQMEPHPTASKS